MSDEATPDWSEDASAKLRIVNAENPCHVEDFGNAVFELLYSLVQWNNALEQRLKELEDRAAPP